MSKDVCERRSVCANAYPDGSLNPDAELLIQPYRDLCARLKKLEDVVDGGQEDLASASSAASRHVDGVRVRFWCRFAEWSRDYCAVTVL